MSAPGLTEAQNMLDAGFEPKEVSDWSFQQKQSMLDAGFSRADVDSHFGTPPFAVEPIAKHFDDNLQAYIRESAAEGAKPKPITSFQEAIEAGLQMSIGGLVTRGKAPDRVITEDTNALDRVAANVTTLAADLPVFGAGYLIGGANPITGTAGAFALPIGIRKILMDKYEKGEVTNFADFWDRLSGAVIDTAKAYVTGAATGAAGKVVGMAPIASPAAKTAAVLGAEITTMVTVGKALEGEIPTAQDFIDTALVLGFVKAGIHGAKATSYGVKKLRGIYAETGVRPQDLAQDMLRDPTISQDLASVNVAVPKAYQQPKVASKQPVEQNAKPIWAMSQGELQEAETLARQSEHDKLIEAFGSEEAVIRWKRLDRLVNSSSASEEVIQSAQKELQVLEARIAPEELDRLVYGVGEKAFTQAEDYKNFNRAIGELDDRSAYHLGQSLRNAVTDIGEATDPRDMNRTELLAYVQLREAFRLAREKGWDTKDVSDAAIKASARRFSDPADAEFMLARFAKTTTVNEWMPGQSMGGGSPGRTRQIGQPPPPIPPKGVVATTPPPPAGGSVEEAQQKILSKISVGGKDVKEPLTFEKMYTAVVDDLNPIREAVKAAAKETVESPGTGELKTKDDPYQLARLTRGTFGKADMFLERSTFDFTTYKNNGEPLKTILEPLKDDLNGLRAYGASRRDAELTGRGIETGLDHEAAKQVVAAGAKQYEPIFRRLVDYQNRLSKYLLDSGVISQKVYDHMLDLNEQFIPFFRVMDDGAMGGAWLGKGVTTKNPIKAIKGSERDIVDPIESVIKNTYTYLALAERNAVGRKYVEMANKSGRPEDFIRKVAPDVKPIEFSESEKRALTDAMGADPNTIPDAVAKVFRVIRTPLEDNQIAVFDKGKRTVYEVDPEVAKAFKSADQETANLLMRILAVPARTLRAGAVLSPEFIARNFTRDQLSAFVFSKNGYLPVFDFVSGLTSFATRDAHFENWLKGGGANSALVSMDRQYLQEHLFKLSQDTGLMSRAINVAKSPLEMLRVTSELVENSTRLGEFKRAVGEPTKGNIQSAAFQSREVTLDFARIGAKARAVNMISAFFSAQVNGVDRLARAIIEEPVSTLTKLGVSITLPSVLLWWANHEDPRYKELPQWQKDLFWIVMTKDVIYRIPKPFEAGIVFGTIPERALDAYYDQNPDAFKNLTQTILDAFLPNPVPTAAAPIIEQFSNRSMFTGNPIIPSRMEKLMPEYQYTEYTTETTKAVGALISAFPGLTTIATDPHNQGTVIGGTARALTTPVLIDNYIRSWTGGLGQHVVNAVDAGLRKAGVVPDPVLPARTLADIPFVKAFVVRYPSSGLESIQKFYDEFYQKEKVHETFMAGAKSGDPAMMERAMTYDQTAIGNRANAIRGVLTQEGSVIRGIYKNPNIPKEEKRQLIDQTLYVMLQLAQEGRRILGTAPAQTQEAAP